RSSWRAKKEVGVERDATVECFIFRNIRHRLYFIGHFHFYSGIVTTTPGPELRMTRRRRSSHCSCPVPMPRYTMLPCPIHKQINGAYRMPIQRQHRRLHWPSHGGLSTSVFSPTPLCKATRAKVSRVR